MQYLTKAKFIFSCCFAVLSHLTQAQAPTWEWQNPKPTGNLLTDVHFFDSQRGIIVGGAGTMLTTTNGGNVWNQVPLSTYRTLNSIFFLNDEVGWICGDSGLILKTIDAGATWTQHSAGNHVMVMHIQFINQSLGWCTNLDGQVYRSLNGGDDWELINSYNTGVLVGIDFVSEEVGWVGTSEGLLKTTDGGFTWEMQGPTISTSLRSFFMLDSLHGWMLDDSHEAYRTADGGETWQSLGLNTSPGSYIHFTTSQSGLIFGRNSMSVTQNGGDTWQYVPTGFFQQLLSVSFANEQVGWAVGEGGLILHTSDGGLSWQSQNSGYMSFIAGGRSTQDQSIRFFTDQIGWAFGEGSSIIRTVNGGETWNEVLINGSSSMTEAVCFINASTAYAKHQTSLYKTIDGGTTWSQISTPTGYLYSRIFFVDENTGWLSGSGFWPYKTVDGGATWIEAHSYNEQTFFKDPDHGWQVNSGRIWSTTDGGSSWLPKAIVPVLTPVKCYFLNNEMGWFAGTETNANGTYTRIYKTTDGGQTVLLQAVLAGKLWEGSNLQFVDSQNGWIAGLQGSVFKTSDGGNTWHKAINGVWDAIYSLSFIDTLHGWVLGHNTMILRTKNGGNLSTAENQLVDEGYGVYPNPADEELYIKTLQSIKRITLFSSNGQSIPAKMENNKIILSGLYPGLYWIRAETPAGLLTRKFVKN